MDGIELPPGHAPVAVRVRDGTRTAIGIVQAVLCTSVIVRFDDGSEMAFPREDVELIGH